MDEGLYQQIIQYLGKSKIPPGLSEAQVQQLINKANHFQEINDQLFKKPRKGSTDLLKVLRRSEFEPLMKMIHNHPTAGHLGVEKTYDRIKGKYYWNQMYDDIKEYIRTCNTCQRFGRPEKKEPLHPIKVGQPFERIGIDIVGPLPETGNKNKYIVVAMDYFTKWPEAKALSNATAENVAKFIYEDIICRHGVPKILLSDQGSHFKNKTITELCERFQINHRFSSPYHPQTNGLVERFNKTLCTTLAKMEDTLNWDKYIPSALFAYRTTIHSTTRYTPFYLTYGRNSVTPLDIDQEDELEDFEISLEDTILQRIFELEEKLPQHKQKVRGFIEKAQDKARERHEKKIRKEIVFKKGDKVLMYDSKLDKQWSGKLEARWKGPFTIHKRLDKGSYILETQFGLMKEPIHSDRLKSYQDRTSWEPHIRI
jgi:hypothetical protein